MKFRTKLLILFIFVSLIPLGVAGWSMIRIAQDLLKDAVNAELISVAGEVTQAIDDSYRFKWLAPLLLIKKSVESEKLELESKLSLMTEGMKAMNDFISLQITVEGFDKPLLAIQDGFSEILADGKLPPAETLEIKPGQFTAGQTDSDVFAGDLTCFPQIDVWTLSIILPMDQAVFGRPAYLCARVNLENLKQRVERHDFNKNGSITLIDADGRKIFDCERPDLKDREIIKKACEFFKNKVRWAQPYISPEGEKYLGAYAFPDSLEIGVVVEKKERDAYQPIANMKMMLLYWVIAGFGIAIAGAIFLWIPVMRPLRKLTEAARLISGGDLSVRIDTDKQGDEIGELSAAFNKMVGDLHDYMVRLTETAKAKQQAESELKLAKTIQQSFLPKSFPNLPEIEVWGQCEPAREVGGDYFDFFKINEDNYGMVMGDVTGKGVPAALFMAVSRTLFRIMSSQEFSPEKVLTGFNERLVALDQGESNMFITLFYGIINTNTGRFLYSTAGHNMPFVRMGGSDRFTMLPRMKTMIAGMISGISMSLSEITLQNQDIVVLYTDGMTEAVNRENEEYGEDRLEKCLETLAHLPAREMCENLIREVQAFQMEGVQFDDMTLFILKVK